MRKFIPLTILASVLLSSCSNTPDAPRSESFAAQPPTGAEASLFSEINRIRIAAGKKPLIRSAKLDALAASDSAQLAASGSRQPNISNLRSRTGFSHSAIIVGALKDRGPETGANYPSYWMKNPRQKGYLLDDWYRIGLGTAKSQSGDLVSIVIFAKVGGATLMNPM